MFSWCGYLIINLVFFPSRSLGWLRLFLIIAYFYFYQSPVSNGLGTFGYYIGDEEKRSLGKDLRADSQ